MPDIPSDLRFWSPRSDSNRRPSDYESKSLRPAVPPRPVPAILLLRGPSHNRVSEPLGDGASVLAAICGLGIGRGLLGRCSLAGLAIQRDRPPAPRGQREEDQRDRDRGLGGEQQIRARSSSSNSPCSRSSRSLADSSSDPPRAAARSLRRSPCLPFPPGVGPDSTLGLDPPCFRGVRGRWRRLQKDLVGSSAGSRVLHALSLSREVPGRPRRAALGRGGDR
jgi:hypothetical protein